MIGQTPKAPFWESFEQSWTSQNKGQFEELKQADPRRLIKAARSQEELFVIYKNFLKPRGSDQDFYNLYRSRSIELGMQPSLVGINPSGQGQFVSPLAPQIYEKYPERKGLGAFAVSRNLYPGIVDYAAISGQKPLFQRSTTGGLANWEAIPQPVKPISAHGPSFVFDLEATGLLGENAQIISAGIKEEGKETQGIYAAFKHDKKLNPQVEKVISLWQEAVRGKNIGEEKGLLTSIIEQFERNPGAAGYGVKQYDIPLLLEASERHGLRTRLEAALAKSEVLDVAEHAISFVSRQMGGEAVGWTKEVTGTLGVKPLGWQLSTMAKAFGYQSSGIAHEAGEDVKATAFLKDVLADEEKAKSLFNKDVWLQGVKESTGREIPLYKNVPNVANFPGLQSEEYYTKPFWEHFRDVPAGEARAKTLLELEQLIPKKAMAAPVIEKAPFLQSSLKGKSILGMALAVGAFGLINNRISGRDDYYNTIESFSHNGMAQFQRRSLTDFGSGYQGINFGAYAGVLQTSWVPASSLGKSPQAIFQTLVTPQEKREPAYEDASSMMGSAAAVGTALHSLEAAKMFSRGYATDVEKTLFDPTNRISGRADIILQSDEPLDIKSVDLQNLQNIMNTGARPKDVSQLNWYMSQMGAERGYLKYEAREDPSQFVWMEVPFSERLLNADLGKARQARMKMLKGLQRGTIDISQIERSSTLEELTDKAMTTERLRPIPELEDEFTRQQELMFDIQRRRVAAYEQPQYSQQWSAKDDNYNTIEALGHGGLSQHSRKAFTEFGSGWDPLRKIAKEIFGHTDDAFVAFRELPEFKAALLNARTVKQLHAGESGLATLMEAKFSHPSVGKHTFQFVKKTPDTPYFTLASEEERIATLRNEFSSLKEVEHRASPSSYGYDEGTNSLFMELMPGDTLENLYKQGKKVPKNLMKRVRKEAKEAARIGIKNADIHSENILYDIHSDTLSWIDFGLAAKQKSPSREWIKESSKEMMSSIKRMEEHLNRIKNKVPEGEYEEIGKMLDPFAALHPGSGNSLGAQSLKNNSDFGSGIVDFVKRISLGFAKKLSRATNKAVKPIGTQTIDDLKVPIQQQLSAFESIVGSRDPLSLAEARFASPEQLQKSFEWSDLVATKLAERVRSADEEVGKAYAQHGKIPSWIPEQQGKAWENRAKIATKKYIKNKQERLIEELNYQRSEVSRLMAGKPKVDIPLEAKEFIEQRKRLEPYVEKKYMSYFEEEFRRRAAQRFGVLQSEINRLEGVAFELENKITPAIVPPRLEKVVSIQEVVDPTRTADLGAAMKRNKKFAKLAESAHGLGLKAEHNASKGHSVCHGNTTRID